MTRVTYDFSGTVALVTGAASGIGLATVRRLALAGGTVAVNDLPGPRLEDTVARLAGGGLDCFAAPGDVGDAASVQAMVAGVAGRAGRLDYLVNNAATPGTRKPIPPDDFARMDEAFWQRLTGVNMVGPYRCTAAAAPFLRAARGAIVNVASTAGLGRGGSSSVYAATKAALILLTREWAFALGPEVRVNAIAPNVVVGSGWDVEFPPEEVERTGRDFPLRRPGTPEDYAEVIQWFLGGAGYVTGQTLVVDGGGPRG
jgi:3-oxoacyl-[acyl-carrier protein] reductase